MLSLPLITPRDSYELWFGSSQPYRSSQNQHTHEPTQLHGHARRNAPATPLQSRTLISSTTPSSSLSALLLEERALRARKQNISSFGYSWIRPAGCAKTMLGMKEEEAEREEALATAAAEMAAAAAAVAADDNDGTNELDGQDTNPMERDLDEDIPDADAEGLIEEGEEDLEDEDVIDEEEFMERDLDDDIPEAFPDDEDDDDEEDDEEDDEDDRDFDEIPVAEDNMSEDMARDLDDDIPEAEEEDDSDDEEDDDGEEEEEEEEGEGEGGGRHEEVEDEWQHTDTDEEFDEDDSFAMNPFRTSTTSSRGGLPPPPSLRRPRETDAQRRFLDRWSGGGDSFDTSGMLIDEDDLRASLASRGNQSNRFRRHRRRTSDRME
ncbi:hypothetical protein ASPZODRAFT_18938 [Penicilliopsis zonata CBS 506.65]|uniref:Apc15p protein n=1 Tax=Penicilliopsis zonata CBS 506.65 TaxID=1073090 RepID=A0A1L9SAF5_9EURO|nr:hypothetical protein ASPZODRAFT_18938 [Penicilliopsis zonata CBS 506.65]OJJ44170.1 hypothetical protein ASPZODRAFT_18938 [Penicilliopsis zonata CBS 506.65]